MAEVTQKSAAEMDAVYAAMLEELGVGRKDTLPLENKKGRNERVDLEALKSDVKINPFAAQWKNAKFDDMDPADLELDSMNDGQSHRKRMLEGLQSTSTIPMSTGGYATWCGRGGGRMGTMAPAGARRVHQSSTRDRVNQGPAKLYHSLGSIFSHLDRASTAAANAPRGASVTGVKGNLRGKSTATEIAGSIQQPRSNLSFNDRRSVDELPITENISTNGFSKNVKRGPIKERSGNSRPARPTNIASLLASPEEFMKHNQPGNTQLKPHTETSRTCRLRVNPHSVKEVNDARHATSAHQSSDKSISIVATPPITVLISPPVILREIRDSESEVVSEFACKIEKTFDINRQDVQTFAGHARVVNFTGYGDITSFLEISDDKRRILCQKLVEANLKVETGSQVMAFETTEIEGTAKWILNFTFSWQCLKFSTALLGLRIELPEIPVTIAGKTKSNSSVLSRINTQDTLISFSDDEDELHHESLSSYTQELAGLVDDTVVDTNFVALNQKGSLLDQMSTFMEKSKSTAVGYQGASRGQIGVIDLPSKWEPLSNQFTSDTISITDLKTFRACGGGLMSSRYAVAATEVSIERLPKEITKGYTQELSRKILHKVEQQTTEAMSASDFDVSLQSSAIDESQIDEMLSRPIRIRYTAEKMKELRSGASNIEGKFHPKNWVTNDSTVRGNSLSKLNIDFVDQESFRKAKYGSRTAQSVDKSVSVSSWGSQKPIDTTRIISPTNDTKSTATLESASTSLLDTTKERSSAIVPKRDGLADSRYAPKTLNTTATFKSDGMGDKSTVSPQSSGNILVSKIPLGIERSANSRFARPSDTGAAKSQNVIFDLSNTTSRPTTSIPVSPNVRSVTIDMKNVDIGTAAASNMASGAETPLLTEDGVSKSMFSKTFTIPSDENKTLVLDFPVTKLTSPLEGVLINDPSISRNIKSSDSYTAHNTTLTCASNDSSIMSSSLSISRDLEVFSIPTNVIFPPTSLIRRDSSSSLNSKRSIDTVKTCKNLQVTTHEAAIPVRPTQCSLGHRYKSSDASSASFATAAEGVVSDNDSEFAQYTSNHLDFVNAIEADIALISPHHGNTSNIELSRTPTSQFTFPSRDMKNISRWASATPVPVSSIVEKSAELSGLNDVTESESLALSLRSMRLFAPFKAPTTPSRLGKRPGLSASRWATDDAKEIGPNPVTRSHADSMDSNSRTFNMNPGKEPFDNVGTQPPRSQCMVPMDNDTGFPNGNPIPTQTTPIHYKPIYQTVLVEDELAPGTYKEVRGMVKLGSVPIVAHGFPSHPQPIVHSDLIGLNLPTSSAPFITMVSPTHATAISASNPAKLSLPAGYFPSPGNERL